MGPLKHNLAESSGLRTNSCHYLCLTIANKKIDGRAKKTDYDYNCVYIIMYISLLSVLDDHTCPAQI